MWTGMFPRKLVLPAIATMLAASVTLPMATPAAAITLYDLGPKPTPVPPLAGGRVVVDWAGVAIVFPETWTVKVKQAPWLKGSSASILVAFGPEGASCLLDRYDPESIETWQDAGVEPVMRLTIDGVLVERFDDMLGTGASRSSAYTIHAPDFQYSLLCAAPEPPDDRWWSIVETVEL